MGLLKKIRFNIFSTSFSLHVAYKKYKIKIYLFSVHSKYISSREMITLEFSLKLRTLESSDVFNTLDKIYLVFTSKK